MTLTLTTPSDLPRCYRCAYYEAEHYIGSPDEEGICRRHAPMPLLDSEAELNNWTYVPSSPAVIPYRDWCGDFTAKPRAAKPEAALPPSS
jgi:hypothetical protein